MNKQTNVLLYISICCCAFIKPDFASAETLDEELQRCSEITVSLIRLQCYDRLAKAPEISAAASNEPKRRSLFQRRSRDTAEIKKEQNTTAQITKTDSSIASKPENINEPSDNFGKIIESESNEISSRYSGFVF